MGEAERAVRANEPARPGPHDDWQVANAERLALLIDADAYFKAFIEAVLRARRALYILGWDLDSRVDLRPGRRLGRPLSLGGLLRRVLHHRPELHVHVLIWDFSPVYTLERELLTRSRLRAAGEGRLHFRYDDHHPAGAAQHQKVVVVDDRLAFIGGIDLTGNRWDTPEHRLLDPRRRATGRGATYGPFHDLQAVVDGPAATALGELVRDRWLRATGEALACPERASPGARDPWPRHVLPDARQLPVGIVRTWPAQADQPAVRETEQFVLGAIASAEREIYIENQYVSAAAVGDVLVERLREPRGPEVVIVTSRATQGWLEQGSMGVVRERLLHRLQASDRSGRLRVCFPVLPGGGDVYVHSKLLIVDGQLAYIGSANLTNRSFGLDSEAGLAIDARERPDVRRALSGWQDRLLAEHLGTTPERLALARRRAGGSLLRLIDAEVGRPHSLVPLVDEVPEWLDRLVPVSGVLDSERPLEAEAVVQRFLPPEGPPSVELGPGSGPLSSQEGAGLLTPTPLSGARTLPPSSAAAAHAGSLAEGGEPEPPPDPGPSRRGTYGRGLLLLGFVIVTLAMWQWTPLADWLSPQRLARLAEPWQDRPLALALTIGVYLVAAFVSLPLNVLVLATILAFGPVQGALYSLVSALASATVSYELGHLLGHDAVRRLLGRRARRIALHIARHGVVTVVLLRMTPVAPFTVVNLLSGAAGVHLAHYLIGTALGLLPGLIALALLGERLQAAIRDPGPWTLGLLAGLALIVAAAVLAVRRYLRPSERTRRAERHDRAGSTDSTLPLPRQAPAGAAGGETVDEGPS